MSSKRILLNFVDDSESSAKNNLIDIFKSQ